MKLIEGQSLERELSRGSMAPEKAAQLIATVAHAVAFAHHRGVLHRDIKPHNILLDAVGQPHLTDFGLAKLLDQESGLTLSAAVIGSPAFMAPEQAAGKTRQVTTAADVYGLGAVLYTLLTGKAVFQADTPLETVRLVIEQEPVRLQALNPSVDRDLETICLKCLQKDPAKRYASAQALAEDLECWLRAEPIQARAVSATEQAWLWCRRKPALATALGTVVLVAAVGFVGILMQWRKAKANELFALQNAYAADMNLAQHAVAANNFGFAESLLDKYRPEGRSEIRNPKSDTQFAPRPSSFASDLRGWEWRYLWQLCQADPSSKLEANARSIGALAISQDGRRIAAGVTSEKVNLWDWKERRLVKTLEIPFEWFGDLRFSRSGHFLFGRTIRNDRTASVRIWRTNDWAIVPLGGAQSSDLSSVDLSPDDLLLATAYADGVVRLGRFPSRERETTILKHARVVLALVFSPDGRVLASVSEDGDVRLWNVVAGRELQPLRGHLAAYSAAFSPDGRRLATGGLGKDAVKLWDIATQRETLTLEGEGDSFFQVACSPDESTLAATSATGVTHLWRAPSWAEIDAAENGQH